MKRNVVAALLCMVLIIFASGHAYAIELDDQPGGVDIHGFISQGFLESNANNFFADTKGGSFQLKDAGFSLSTDLSGRLKVGMQVLAYEMGGFGNDNLRINWANGDFAFNENLGIKVGKMKLQHGLYNASRDGDFLRTTILLPQSIYNEAWRSTVSAVSGVEVYGSAGGGELGRLTYNAQAGQVDIHTDSGVAVTTVEKLFESGTKYDLTSVDSKTIYSGHLLWDTPVPGLSLNTTYWTVALSMKGTASGTRFPVIESAVYDTKANSMTSSIEYSYENLLLVTEYSLCKYDFSLPPVFSNKKLDTEGYYVGASYRFKDWLESEMYYSVYYPDKDDKTGENINTSITPRYSAWLKDTCLAFRFDITDNWVFKLESHLMDGTAVMRHENNPNASMKQNWALFGAKMTFSF